MERDAREVKRSWLEERAPETEKAGENVRSRELYNITRTIIGEKKKTRNKC